MSRVAVLEFLIHLLIFFLGAGIGSFLNVVIYRLPLGISVNNPKRSFCPLCKKQIPWYQNLPLFSWILLRAKCAACKAPIPFRYFFVELLTGCIFYAIFLHFRDSWDTRFMWGDVVILYWIFAGLLIAGTFIDFDHYILPHEITFGGLAVGLLGGWIAPEIMGEYTRVRGFLHSLAGACVGASVIWTIVQLGKLAFGRVKRSFEKPETWSISQPKEDEPPVFEIAGESLSWHDIFFRPSDRLVLTCTDFKVKDEAYGPCVAEIRVNSLKIRPENGQEVTHPSLEEIKRLDGTARQVLIPREAMGYGDIFLMAMIGSFLGWQAVLFTVVTASVLGSILGVVPRFFGKTEWTSKIPFGPYLSAGAMIWLFYGPQIVDWYMNRMRGGDYLDV
ncbi:MAG TPA: prepilin peptidase [Verrucomicrobium sp.]|nr:prepilin peptidase [Verrucomicrobium sp.]